MNKNILFITSDQQHYMSMGYRNPEVRTPNLDRLVQSGTTFHRAYTVNPTCTPTRCSWITGMYPSQHGAYSLGTKLMEDVPTVGSYFSEYGYETALVGKAHFQPLLSTEEFTSLEAYPVIHNLDFWRQFNGPFYGFNHVELARNHTDEFLVGQHYALWMEEKGFENWRDYFLPNPPGQTVKGDSLSDSKHTERSPGEAWEIPEEIHYSNWISERCNALLEEYVSEEKPFFLWASFFDPHPQYMVPEPYASMYDPNQITVPEHIPGEFDDKPPYFRKALEKNPDFSSFEEEKGNTIHGSRSHLSDRKVKAENIATMYGMMTMLDEHIGRIIDKVDELGIREETLICFTTDHGDFLGQHGLTMKAIHHYEDLLKVPLVVSLPGTIPEGIVSNSLQSTLDIPETFCTFAGLPVPERMTGLDETEVWCGKQKTIRDYVIVENQHQPNRLNIRSFITEKYKITIHLNQDYGELYNLEEDVDEIRNLWDSEDYKEIKCTLLRLFLYGEMEKAPVLMPRIAQA